MQINMSPQPIAIAILVFPRLLNYIVAIYLIYIFYFLAG